MCAKSDIQLILLLVLRWDRRIMQCSHSRDREVEEVSQEFVLVKLETERKQANQLQRNRQNFVVISVQSITVPGSRARPNILRSLQISGWRFSCLFSVLLLWFQRAVTDRVGFFEI